jgi:hypothetical protein
MLKVLSLGVGVQSSTVLLMSVRGVLPKLDAAVFADPGWESPKTYAYLEYLKPIAEAAGIKLVVGTNGNIRKDAMTSQVGWDRETTTLGSRWASMPMFVLNPDGTRGMVNRQCTSKYKIDVIKRELKRLLGITGTCRSKEPLVEQWIGISYDEISRMRKSDVRWLSMRYPLIHDLSRKDCRHLYPVGFTRDDCIAWLSANGFLIPPRSACIGCPFHSDAEWMRMKTEDPADFEDSCKFDEAIRNCGGKRGQMFLHSSCVPLREVVFKVGAGGLGLAAEECQGMCGN